MESKIIFLIGVLIAIFISVSYKTSTRKYSSTAIIDYSATGPSKISGIENADGIGDIAGLLHVRERTGNATILVPKVTGREFLEQILENKSFSQELEKHCMPRQKPKLLTFLGFLEFFDVYKIKDESFENKNNYKVDCLISMIQVKKYIYKQVASRGYSIIVTATDPFFAAYLANFIVDKFLNQRD